MMHRKKYNKKSVVPYRHDIFRSEDKQCPNRRPFVMETLVRCCLLVRCCPHLLDILQKNYHIFAEKEPLSELE